MGIDEYDMKDPPPQRRRKHNIKEPNGENRKDQRIELHATSI